MARRKSKFLSDDDDSDSSAHSDDLQDDPFDPNDEDQAAERELFRNPYQRGKKRNRDDIKDDQTYGVFAHSPDSTISRPSTSSRGAKRTDYTRAQVFVSAGASSSKAPSAPLDNLADTANLAIEPAADDEEDIAMELGSSASEQDDDQDDAEAIEEDEPEEDEEELAAVPGLAPSPPPPAAPVVEETPLAFAPRGIGARGGRGGIGARPGGGIGSGRAGIGGRGLGAGADSVSSAPPVFASATSASTIPLGGTSTFNPSSFAPAASTSGADSPMAGAATPRLGLGASSGGGGAGIGSPGVGKVGIGARPAQSLIDSLKERLAAEEQVASPSPSSASASPSPAPENSVDAAPPRERRSFLPTAAPEGSHLAPKKISKKEQQHFAQLESSGSLGLKMLQKMGWKSGTGLGVNEQGIVTPIGEGQKLRKKGAGIASGERSAGSLAEAARMRGEDPDEIDAAEKDAAKALRAEKAEKAKAAKKDAWQQLSSKRKEQKVKTEYKTYEQIVAESGAEPEGVGMLVDLSGNALSSQSLSHLPAFGAGSADPTRLPELRHNLTLLTSTLSSTLSSLAREGKGISERRSYLAHEEERVRTAVESQERKVKSLREVMVVVGRVKEKERDAARLLGAAGGEQLGPKVLLDPFVDEFDELLGQYPNEYEDMGLDEVVVGAIAPICRRLFQDWDPLSHPSFAVAELKRWRKHFLIDKDVVKQDDGMDVDVFGAASYSNGGNSKKASDRNMTAYETLMWTIWLPRVRSAINNAWTPTDPTPIVSLFTSWSPLLPLFLRDNILDQLILPKVSKAISDWSPSALRRGGAALHTIVFPWLELAGERMEGVLDEAKRRVRSWLKGWKASEGVPTGLDTWRDAFTSTDWDALILKHVLPQLGSTLRERFTINPRAQDLKPLEDVLAWSPLLRSSVMSQLLETEFFPKWLDALYLWLTSTPNLEQVAEWYSYWKGYFPDEVIALSGVSRGFRKGLDLMNQAMALGDDAKYRLKRPDTTPAPSSSSRKSSSTTATPRTFSKSKPPTLTAATAPSELDDITFRSVVEDLAAQSNLMFLATGKSDERGHALFRVSQTIDGKSGVTVYLEDDVVWVLEKGEYKPVGVEEMVRRALAK